MKRRSFIKQSTYLGLGALLPVRTGGCSRAQGLDAIGLQLTSVKDAMQRDTSEALRRVADIGYSYVEGSGYINGRIYRQSIRSFKALLERYELTMPSGQVSWSELQAKPERVIAECKMLGQSFVVVSGWTVEKRTKEGYTELVNLLNRAGEQCRQRGMQLVYQHRDAELQTVAGVGKVIDFLLDNTDPEAVQFELDFFWLTRGRVDWKSYFETHSGRFPLWHLSDVDDSLYKMFTPVGEGIVDWGALFSEQANAGMKYFFVKQEQARKGASPFDEVTQSYEYLKTLKIIK